MASTEIWRQLAGPQRRAARKFARDVYAAVTALESAADEDVGTLTSALAVRARLFSDLYLRQLQQAEAKAKGAADD